MQPFSMHLLRYGLCLVLLALLALPAAAQPALSSADAARLALDDPAVTSLGMWLDVEGDLAFVGEPEQNVSAGAVKIYRRYPENGRWSRVDSLGQGGPLDAFGQAFDADGDWLLVGAPGQDAEAGADVGAVYAYERDGTSWTLRQVLEGEAAGANMGFAVAVSGTQALVGAPGQEAAYVLSYDGEAWSVAQALAPDADEPEAYGYRVALSDAAAAVTSLEANEHRGAVTFYDWDGEGFVEATRVEGPAANSLFGYGLDLEGTRGVVGAPGVDSYVGRGFVYERTEGGWTSTALPQPEGGHTQGLSAALSGDRVLLGAPINTQTAFTFVLEDGAWVVEEELVASRVDDAQFGYTVALDGDAAAVGAPDALGGLGQAVLFNLKDEGWEAVTLLEGTQDAWTSITGARVPCQDGQAADFPCQDVDLLSFLALPDLGATGGVGLNDIWGWTAEGREFAVAGRTDGTAFVEVTDPLNPVYLGELLTNTGVSTWRDVKVYDDHALIVADAAGQHGMQVFDLTRLLEVADAPVTFESDAVYDRFRSAHNVVVNEETGYAYAVGISGAQDIPQGYPNFAECGPGLHIIDVRDPSNPTFAGCFEDERTGRRGTGYTHDAQCVVYTGPDATYQGREVCFGANETALSIADVTDKDAPFPIAFAQYPNTGYAHQGWLTEDQRYFIQNDETDETSGLVPSTRTLVWDVTDLEVPELVTEYFSGITASDHNHYVQGDYLYQSNYASGLRILNIEDPEAPYEVGFFDTYPQGDVFGFSGTWSNYPYFESGTLVMTGRGEGLFVLDPSPAVGVASEEPAVVAEALSLSPVQPNPFWSEARVRMVTAEAQQVRVVLYDALGRAVATLHDGPARGEMVLRLDGRTLPSGLYLVRATGEHGPTATRTVTLVR